MPDTSALATGIAIAPAPATFTINAVTAKLDPERGRRDGAARMANVGPSAAPHKPRTIVEIEHAVALKLRPAARVRGTTVPALVRDIIDTIATEKLVDAVLDDRG